jgi:hypothetical protein
MQKSPKNTEPIQRLTRMRDYFEKDRSVLTVDYEFFITTDVPVMPRASTPRSKAARKSEELSVPKPPKQS